jgi:hypothetical protein
MSLFTWVWPLSAELSWITEFSRLSYSDTPGTVIQDGGFYSGHMSHSDVTVKGFGWTFNES